MGKLFIFLILSLIWGCQVKENPKNEEALFVGHRPVDNQFSVSTLLNTAYVADSLINIIFTFPTEVEVKGTPSISLTIGVNQREAKYLSGTGTNSLTFSYQVQAGENDANGIELGNTIDLNGGSIVYHQKVDCNLAIIAPNLTSVLVDTTSPTIVQLTPPLDGVYVPGSNLNFSFKFSEKIKVTGTPILSLKIGTTTVSAKYSSGQGTDTLTFKYVPTAADNDYDGIEILPINLSGGTITDLAGNHANLSFVTPNTPGIKIDGINLRISSILPPTAKTYLLGNQLDFKINFSSQAFVSGVPRMKLTVGSASLYATYHSGSGTKELVFRYVVGPNDLDLDGIATAGPTLNLNGGSILNSKGGNSNLSIVSSHYPKIKVDGISPEIILVTGPLSQTYTAGTHLLIKVKISEPVKITGIPRLELVIGSQTKFATYHSGTSTNQLTFRYTVLLGDNDEDGIEINSPLRLNGGSIKDLSGNKLDPLSFTAPDTSSVFINTSVPTITSVSPPADGTYPIDGELDFIVTFSADAYVTGTPRMALSVGNDTLYATYIEGSGSTEHLYRYIVSDGDDGPGGISNLGPQIDLDSGTIRDALNRGINLNFTGDQYPDVKVDGIRPYVTDLSISSDKTYIIDDEIILTATYSEDVEVTGTPEIQLTIGNTTRYASYDSSNSSGDTVVFKYQVTSGDLDSDGIEIANTMNLTSGVITDTAGNPQIQLSINPPDSSGIIVNGINPYIVSITPPNSQIYGLAATLDFKVQFSENVTITGTPQLKIDVGGNVIAANYFDGSGTNEIIFQYTVANNDNDSDGVATLSPLDLDDGTIKSNDGNDAQLNFTALTYANVKVDTQPPSINSVTLPANNTYQQGSARNKLSFIVHFTEKVTIADDTPRLHVEIGQETRFADYVSGSGTSNLTFEYLIENDDLDLDGISITHSGYIDLNNATIRDDALNDASLDMGTLNTSKIFVVLPSMRNWYDLSDSSKIILSSGKVTELRDKIGTYHLSYSLAGGANYSSTGFNSGSNAYATCVSPNAFQNTTATMTPLAFVAVFRPNTAASTETLFSSTSTTRPMVEFTSPDNRGTVSFGVDGAKFSGSVWSVDDASHTDLWSTNTPMARGFSWSSQQNRAHYLCQMNGQISEAIFFSSVPTEDQMTLIENYINQRYGLSFPSD